MYAVQVGIVDVRHTESLQAFELTLETNDVDVEQVERFIPVLQNVGSLFAMGPRTGPPMVTSDLANQLLESLYRQCPSGQVTGLASSRLVTDHAFVVRHAVRVTGYCLTDGRW